MPYDKLPAYLSVQYIGQIQEFPYNHIPYGWVECNGQLLSVDNNPYLYKAIGTIYGSSGTVSFAVPDLRPKDGNGDVINLAVGQVYNGKPYMKSFIALEGVYPGTQSYY
jgi:microcystin-dependent protein